LPGFYDYILPDDRQEQIKPNISASAMVITHESIFGSPERSLLGRFYIGLKTGHTRVWANKR